MILVVAATERELAGVPPGAATLACGVGPVEAAAATARALAQAERRPCALVHVGLAGARGIEPPALVLGAEAVYEDIGAAIPVVDRALPDPALLERARRALPQALVRAIGTTARVGATSVCEVEAMEGFAVLRAAALVGVPALELRAVANDVDEPDRTRWRFDEALDALAAALPRLLSAL